MNAPYLPSLNLVDAPACPRMSCRPKLRPPTVRDVVAAMARRPIFGILAALFLSSSVAVLDAQSVGLRRTAEGAASGQRIGTSVAGGHDINGDGIPDFVTGAPLSDVLGTDAGSAFAYSGATGAVLFSWNGVATADRFGSSIALVGDLDGDGKSEIIVGAPQNDAGGTNSGRVYAFSGATGAILWTLTGQNAGDRFGFAVAAGRDITGDGIGDIVVGAPQADAVGVDSGKVYLFSGANAQMVFVAPGYAADDRFGSSVDFARDFDGNGVEDIVAGSPRHDASGSDAGRVDVLDGFTGSSIRAILPPTSGRAATFVGLNFGIAVSGVGDVDGDQLGDLVVGTETGDVVHCLKSGTGSLLYQRMNSVAGEKFATALAGVGDLDADGISDFAVGARKFGLPSGGFVQCFSGKDGIVIAEYRGLFADEAGTSVAAAGDLDADGRDEFVVGAPVATSNSGAIEAGRVSVFSATLAKAPPPSDVLARFFTDTSMNSAAFASASGGFDFTGDGISDIVASEAASNGPIVWIDGAGGAIVRRQFTQCAGTIVRFVGDVNDDGIADIVENHACGSTALSILSGATGQSIGSINVAVPVPAEPEKWIARMGDVNFDSRADFLVYQRTSNVLVRAYFGGSTTPAYSITLPFSQSGGVAPTGDVNGDGASDFVVYASESTATSGVYSGASGQFLHAAPFGSAYSDGGRDVDDDTIPDQICANTSINANQIGIAIVSGSTGAIIFAFPTTGVVSGPIWIADLNADLCPEFAYRESGVGIVVRSGKTGEILTTIAAIQGVAPSDAILERAFDADQDGIGEILVLAEYPSLGTPDVTDQAYLAAVKVGPVLGACSLSALNLLTVNGQIGGPGGRVDVGIQAPISIDLAEVPGVVGAPYVIYGFIGVPSPQDAIAGMGFVGQMCFMPYHLNPADPALFVLTSYVDPADPVSLYPGTQLPWHLSLPNGLKFPFTATFQGIVLTPALTATNAVILDVK